MADRELLGDRAAHGEAGDVRGPGAERAQHVSGVLGHRLDADAGGRERRAARAAVVGGDHAVGAGERVDLRLPDLRRIAEAAKEEDGGPLPLLVRPDAGAGSVDVHARENGGSGSGIPDKVGSVLAPNRPDVLDEVFDGEAVLVNLRTGRYYSLDAAATEVWGAVVAGEPLPDGGAAFARRLVDEELAITDELLPEPSDDGGPTMEVFTDMEDILLLDPIHDVDYEAAGWPTPLLRPPPNREPPGLRREVLAAADAVSPCRTLTLSPGAGVRIAIAGDKLGERLAPALAPLQADAQPAIEITAWEGTPEPPPCDFEEDTFSARDGVAVLRFARRGAAPRRRPRRVLGP